jgi:hypothetical protein
MPTKLLLGLAAALAGTTLAIATAPQNSPDVQKRLNAVRHELQSVKGDLAEMDCCIEPSCNFCPLAAGKCLCAQNLKTKTGVCGECYDGWRAGQGHVAGVDPKNVPSLPDAMVVKMYRMKAEHFGKTEGHSRD